MLCSPNEAQFGLAYCSPTELAHTPDEISLLQEELGQSALKLSKLDAEIQDPQSRPTSLEINSNNHTYVELSRIQTSTDSSTEIDLTPDPTLSPKYQKYEQAILYLLGTPDRTVRRPDAGGFLKSKLGIEKAKDWSNMRSRLEELGIITIIKATPRARRSTAINLNIDGVLASIDKPFITPRILNILREANTNPDISRERKHGGEARSSEHLLEYRPLSLRHEQVALKGLRNSSTNRTQESARKSLTFGFRVEGTRFDKKYSGHKFAVKESEIKLMLAIGQASTFSQTDEQYVNYLHRMANKGITTEAQIGAEEVSEVLHALVSKGLCLNGSTRYRLTSEGLKLLISDSRKDKFVQPELKTASENTIQTSQDSLSIKPLDLPNLPNGELDETQINADKKIIRSFGRRALEVLAELEQAGGIITDSQGYLAGTIRNLTGADVGNDSYAHSLADLKEKGLVDISANGAVLTLTNEGEAMIALMKSHPDDLKEEAQQSLKVSTSLQIIELIMHETGVALETDAKLENLPDSTDWLLPLNSILPLIPRIAQALNKSEEAIVRRIYDMKKVKGYIETEGVGDNENNLHAVTNIRILRKGLEYALMSQQKQREREQVLDESEVEEAQELIDGCLHLTEALNETQLHEQLKEQFDNKSLFELTSSEFIEEKSRLEALFEALRRNYIFKNGRQTVSK